MGLDARGDIAIFELAFYAVIFVVSLDLIRRHGFRHDAGWVYLLALSITRLVGSSVLIAAEATNSRKTSVYIVAYVLESAGLTPLMLAALGFLKTVGQHSLRKRPIFPSPVFLFLHMHFVACVVLAIVGGTQTSASSAKTGAALRKASAVLYIAGFLAVANMHVIYWIHKNDFLQYRRTLLIGITAALPFIAVRIAYAALSSFSPGSYVPSATTQKNSLSKFNSVSGSWQINLAMSLIMEFITVVIYCTVGTLLPLQREGHEAVVNESGASSNEQHPMYNNAK